MYRRRGANDQAQPEQTVSFMVYWCGIVCMRGEVVDIFSITTTANV